MLTYILFFIGFFILIKGADLLVDGASSIAHKLNISDLVIGLTVVSFGTSAPELFVNITASINGNTDIAIGNVIGSNIANVFLILGVAAVIYPMTLTRGTIKYEIPFCFGAALLLGVLANDGMMPWKGFSALTRVDGFIFLACFAGFMFYSFKMAGKAEEFLEREPGKEFGLPKSIIMTLIGLVALGFGGKWIVDGAVKMAISFGVSESFVGLTIVSIGTSLPELAASAVAAFKKNSDIAVGNVIGSNIFNIFLVLGASAAVKPLPFQFINNVDIGVVILSTLLLLLFMWTGKKSVLDRWEAILFLLSYVGYIVYLVFRG